MQRTHARTLTGTDPGAGPRGCGARTAGGAQGPAATPRSRAFWKEEPATSVGRGRGRSGGSRFPHASPRLHPLPARPRSAHAMDGHVATATAPQQPPPPPGSQHGRGTSGPALPVPQFPLLYSDHLRLARKEGRSGQGRSPPRSSRSPAVAALLPRTAPEPRPLRHPRANRSETDPGTCSSLPLWLCLATTPRVTRCQHQLWSCLLEHRGPWPRRSHAATSPQGSQSGEATARAPWHPGPAATVTLSRAPLSLRPLRATEPGASPPWGGDGGPARDSGRRHPRPRGRCSGATAAKNRQRGCDGRAFVPPTPGMGWPRPDTPRRAAGTAGKGSGGVVEAK